MAAEILVRPLHTLDEFRRCVQIAREVWGDSDLDTEPYVTLVIADHTGGQVLGAFDGDLMVGFTKAYVGLHDRTPYLHSHMTGVLASHRDRRVGRYLKLFQREDALRRGIRLVEWHLDTKRVVGAVNDITPEPRECPAHVHLPVSAAIRNAVSFGRPSEPVVRGESASLTDFPGAPSDLQAVAPSATTSCIEVQSRIRAEFTEWFSKGYAVLGVRTTVSGVDYCLAPYSDF